MGSRSCDILSGLTDSELTFLQRDVSELGKWISEAHNALVIMRHPLLVEMYAKGEGDPARHLAIAIQKFADPMVASVMDRFFEQAGRKEDSREALAAACAAYQRRTEQLTMLAKCMNHPLESLAGYEKWRDADEKYEEVLKDKLEKHYLRRVRDWWSTFPASMDGV